MTKIKNVKEIKENEAVKDTVVKEDAKKAVTAKSNSKTTRSKRTTTTTKSTRTTKAKAKTLDTKKTATVAKKTEVKEVATIKATGANLSEVLGNCEVKLIKINETKTASNYPINVALKNLGFEKVVKVRYTEDNWKTEKEESLQFINQKDNLEEWGTVLKLDEDKKDNFEYVIRYKVNDWTYWDNNLDENYKF